jgi:hypothetical protein
MSTSEVLEPVLAERNFLSPLTLARAVFILPAFEELLSLPIIMSH